MAHGYSLFNLNELKMAYNLGVLNLNEIAIISSKMELV